MKHLGALVQSGAQCNLTLFLIKLSVANTYIVAANDEVYYYHHLNITVLSLATLQHSRM